MQESILTAADNGEFFTGVRFFLHAGGGAGFSTARLLIDGAQNVHNLRAQQFFCGRICPFVHILTGDIHILCTTGSIFAQKAASLPHGRSSFSAAQAVLLCAPQKSLRPKYFSAPPCLVRAFLFRSRNAGRGEPAQKIFYVFRPSAGMFERAGRASFACGRMPPRSRTCNKNDLKSPYARQKLV